MPRPRLRFTIGQLMILIAVVGLLLGIAAWAYSNPNVIVVALVSLIVLGPICLQLHAILWRDTP
jgi:CHASE2 domain-containing sensor protein